MLRILQHRCNTVVATIKVEDWHDLHHVPTAPYFVTSAVANAYRVQAAQE